MAAATFVNEISESEIRKGIRVFNKLSYIMKFSILACLSYSKIISDNIREIGV